jgi:predicted esterase
MARPELDFIHRWVPPAEAAPPFTLLLLHGTGGDEADLLPLAQAVAPGLSMLSPRGKVLEAGRPRFFRRLAEGVFDVEDVKLRAHELADFVQAASARYRFDAGRVVAFGYSNGANIAAAVLLLRPETLAGAVLLRPMVPIEPETPPDLAGKRVLLLSGILDPIVAPEQPQRLAQLLRNAGADVTLNWTDSGHQPGAEDLEAARHWLTGLR